MKVNSADETGTFNHHPSATEARCELAIHGGFSGVRKGPCPKNTDQENGIALVVMMGLDDEFGNW